MGLISWVEDKAESAYEGVSDAASTVADGATSAYHAVGDAASTVYDGASSMADSASGYIQRGEKAVTDGARWVEDEVDTGSHALANKVADVPVLGSVANFAADSVTTMAQVDAGIVEGATGLVGGVANAVVHPINTVKGLETMAEHIPGPAGDAMRFGHNMLDVATGDESFGTAMDRSFNPLTEAKENGAYWSNVGGALIAPYKESYNQGRYGEMVGRGAFDIGTLLCGAGEVEAGADAARVADVADVARTADAADVARTADVADTARTADVADTARTADAADATKLEDVRAGDEIGPSQGHAGGGSFVDSIDPAAEAAYDDIRAAKGDAATVAEKNGLPPDVAERVKNHLFNDTHDLTTAEGQANVQERFVAIQEYADLWKKAQAGTLEGEEAERFADLVTHENVEATLAERGVNILEPEANGMRPFKASSAHDLASIAERNFPKNLFDKIPPEVREAQLRPMVEATLDARGSFTAEQLAGMPEEVQQTIADLMRERAAGGKVP